MERDAWALGILIILAETDYVWRITRSVKLEGYS
jgi:hypothetical protein